jgi:methylmalonyl-CoA/ethylmalonyl-CoA epimerase
MVDRSESVRFHHVGLVVRRPTDLWPVMAGVLGGQYVSRGTAVGYGWTQLRFANGFILEGLHPEGNEGSEFLERFLQRSGVGPHHLTFHVDDLAAMIQVLREAGLHPLAEVSNELWHEVSLHPHEAHGTVVQLVQNAPDVPPGLPEPEGFPEASYDAPVASLGRVVHAVKDLSAALVLYRDVLGGRVMSTGSAVDGNHWTELGWGGPGRLRLLEATHAEISQWVGSRPGRTRHLFFSFDQPEYVPGVVKVAAGRWVVEPNEVLGTRFVISSSAR